MMLLRLVGVFVALALAAGVCAQTGTAPPAPGQEQQAKKQQKQQDPQRQEQQSAQQPPVPKSDPAPRSQPEEGVSSSKESRIDTSPPPGDAAGREGAEVDDVQEFHPYDPHKAEKNVEVGDFYYKRGNYRAAASRYAEALQWKPRDAEATFKLAQALEKLGRLEEARENYRSYLKILPKGADAAQAQEAISRLDAKLPPPGQRPASPISQHAEKPQ